MADRETIVRELSRIVRFGLVGLANTAVHLIVFFALVAVGVPYLLASILGSATAIAVAYFLNHRLVFRADQHTRQLVVQFFIVQGIGGLINAVALAIAVEQLHWSPVVAQIAVLIPVVATTFTFNRLVVFRAHVDTRGAGG